MVFCIFLKLLVDSVCSLSRISMSSSYSSLISAVIRYDVWLTSSNLDCIIHQ